MDYVTDDERVEQLKKWWKDNGTSLILGVVLGLAILFGWRWWGNYVQTRAMNASATYSQLVSALKSNQEKQAQTQMDELIQQYSKTPYAVAASLEMARHKVDRKNLAGAKANLQWALEHNKDEQLQPLIQVRLAKVLLALGEADAAMTQAGQVKAEAFIAAAEEIKGDVYLKQGKRAEAYVAYQKALNAAVANGQNNPALQLKMEGLSGKKQDKK